MRIIVHAQVQWQLFTALYPLFKHSLPQIRRSSSEDQDLRIQNAITTIRHHLLAIPLQLQQVQLNQDLPQADFDRFLEALIFLLNVFERLVEEDVCQHIYNLGTDEHDTWSRSQYPKLTTLKNLLLKSRSGPATADSDTNLASDWHEPTESSSDILSDLGKYINFHGSKSVLEYQYISREIRGFNSKIKDIFHSSLGTSDDSLGNAFPLRDDEINFIRRAHRLNLLSSSLFALLGKSIACSKAHTARLHLSGFLDPDLTFDLHIAACEKRIWNCAKCRWVSERPTKCDEIAHIFCIDSEHLRDESRSIQIAFDDGDIWDDAGQGPPLESAFVPELLPTLGELVFRGSDSFPCLLTENCEFEPEDQKIVQLLLASSLLHLNTNQWLRREWELEKILMLANPSAQDPLKRWKPHVACSLGSSAEVCSDNYDDILSFGLLIVEMEAKRKIKANQYDNDWITGLPSKDSMLKRALTDWNRRLEDGYRAIGRACLQFRELAERLYHPALTNDMRRTAAIYKYILTPLRQLVTQRYCSTSQQFSRIPRQSDNHSVSASYPHHFQPSWSSRLILFDDSKSDSTWHNPLKIEYASEFMRAIKPFVDMIRYLSVNCDPLPALEQWRARKIRIAIIDTGIDTEDDILIQTALESGRIRACRGFINDPGDYKDSHGHGTHVARLILSLAPAAELYIAKVSDSKVVHAAALQRISEAIRWAHKTINVDLISMSFGLEPDNRNEEIDRAINNAFKSNITMIAAAANNGGNKPRAYPASRRTGVLCIHASDGRGNDGEISPTPESKKDNFSTLGISIESKWKGEKVLKSGTSFATPIATSLAADMLEFARYKCSLSEYEQESLHSFDGVAEMLRLISAQRQGYDYIMPLHLWKYDTESEIARKITRIVASR